MMITCKSNSTNIFSIYSIIFKASILAVHRFHESIWASVLFPTGGGDTSFRASSEAGRHQDTDGGAAWWGPDDCEPHWERPHKSRGRRAWIWFNAPPSGFLWVRIWCLPQLLPSQHVRLPVWDVLVTVGSEVAFKKGFVWRFVRWMSLLRTDIFIQCMKCMGLDSLSLRVDL